MSSKLSVARSLAGGYGSQMTDDFRIIDSRVLAKGWGTLTEYTVETGPADARIQLTREVYDKGHAAVILLYNRERGTVLLVRQPRVPALLGGDDPRLLEACAGLLDEADPEACARREAEEECGHRPVDVTHAFTAYMSPGNVTIKMYCYLGAYSAETRISDGGGLAEEHEDIELVELQFAEAMAMIRRGELRDGKTIMLLQHLALSGLMAS